MSRCQLEAAIGGPRKLAVARLSKAAQSVQGGPGSPVPCGAHLCKLRPQAGALTAVGAPPQLELYGKVEKESSKVQVAPRSVLLVVAKAEPGFWPRLQRQKGKTPQNIKVDWSKARGLCLLSLSSSRNRVSAPMVTHAHTADC